MGAERRRDRVDHYRKGEDLRTKVGMKIKVCEKSEKKIWNLKEIAEENRSGNREGEGTRAISNDEQNQRKREVLSMG